MKRFALVVGLAVVGIPSIGLHAQPSTTATPSVDLPSIETLLSEWTKATGGRASLDKMTTVHIVMQMTAEGQVIDVDAAWSRKGGRLATMKLPMGEMTAGTDGTTAWMKNPMGGYQLAAESAKGQLKLAELLVKIADPSLMDEKERKGVTVVGKEKFEGKDCFKVLSPKGDDGPASYLFLDAATGLPSGSTEQDGKGMMTIGEWKSIDGVKFPHSLTMKGMGNADRGSAQVRVSLIEMNKPEESAFALPEEVKKLAPGGKTPAAAEAEIKLEDLPKANQKEAERMVQSLGSMELKMLKQLETSMGMGLDYLPEDKKLLMKFYVQEIRKEIAKRG